MDSGRGSQRSIATKKAMRNKKQRVRTEQSIDNTDTSSFHKQRRGFRKPTGYQLYRHQFHPISVSARIPWDESKIEIHKRSHTLAEAANGPTRSISTQHTSCATNNNAVRYTVLTPKLFRQIPVLPVSRTVDGHLLSRLGFRTASCLEYLFRNAHDDIFCFATDCH